MTKSEAKAPLQRNELTYEPIAACSILLFFYFLRKEVVEILQPTLTAEVCPKHLLLIREAILPVALAANDLPKSGEIPAR